jgi:thiol-disulfide isomerase/thioredoxin
MKNISSLLFFCLICLGGCKTTKPIAEIKPVVNQKAVSVVTPIAPPVANFSDPSTWLLGYFNHDRLTREPYSVWYLKGYDEYMINSEAVNKLFDINKDNLTIKIILGTWCPDSRREVPKFMRVLDIWRFPVSMVTFIGVDNAKLSQVDEYKSLNILRVPTFIIYKNNIEAGRIIENPSTSLEQDIVNILTRNE